MSDEAKEYSLNDLAACLQNDPELLEEVRRRLKSAHEKRKEWIAKLKSSSTEEIMEVAMQQLRCSGPGSYAKHDLIAEMERRLNPKNQ